MTEPKRHEITTGQPAEIIRVNMSNARTVLAQTMKKSAAKKTEVRNRLIHQGRPN